MGGLLLSDSALRRREEAIDPDRLARAVSARLLGLSQGGRPTERGASPAPERPPTSAPVVPSRSRRAPSRWRVAFLLGEGAPGGGAERSGAATLAGLSAHYETHLLIRQPSAHPVHGRIPSPAAAGVHFVHVCSENGVADLLKALSPDVVIGEGSGRAGEEAAALGRFRPLVIESVRNAARTRWERIDAGFRQGLCELLAFCGQRLADVAAADRPHWWADESRVAVIANGVPLAEPEPRDRFGRRRAARRELGLTAEVPVVGYVGRLVAYKGLEQVADAFFQHAPQSALLLVAGAGPEAEALAWGRGAKRRVRVLGYLDDPNLAYDAADVILAPSQTAEGFFRVPFEAAGRAVPCVTTPVGDVPVVFQDGTSAAVATEAAGLGNALSHLLTHPRTAARLGRCARTATEVAGLDERVMQQRWLWLVDALLGRPWHGAPSVSVVLPCGRPMRDQLGNTLESLRRQTYPLREVIVVHDGSPSDARALSVWLSETFPDTRLVRQNRLQNCRSATRNEGMEAAGGDLIVFLDAECLLARDALERVAAGLAVYDDALVVPQRQRIETPSGLSACLLEPAMKRWLSLVPEIRGSAKDTRRLCAAAIGPRPWAAFSGPLLALRREAARTLGGWDEGYRGWGVEDTDFTYRALRAGLRPLVGPVAFHQEHPVEKDQRGSLARNKRRFVRRHGVEP